MTNIRSLLLLVLITGVVVAAAWYWSREPGDTAQTESETVLPGLAERAERTARVKLVSGESTLTLARSESDWTLEERGGYAVESDRVRQLINGLVELVRLEAKTSKPENYAALDLVSPGADSATRQVTLIDASGSEIANILLGKRQPSRADTRLDEIYVRTPNDPQTWLAEGRLPDWQDATDWLQAEVMDIPRARIQRVEVDHPDGSRVSASRSDEAQADFALLALAPGESLKSATDVNGLANAFTGLTLDDVRKDADLPDDLREDIKARMSTFDGLVIDVTLLAEGDERWARLAASYVAPEAAPTPAANTEENADQAEETDEAQAAEDEAQAADEDSSPDPEAEAASLNARWSGWLYKLPDYRLDGLTRPRSELVETAEAAGEAETTEGTETNEATE